MKTVLVTGASGFLGRHCAPALVERGFAVHAVSRSAPVETVSGVTWHRHDMIAESRKVEELIAHIRPTHLLHVAWVVTPGEYLTSSLNLRWVQVSLGLLQAFVAAGSSLAFVGTCAEYEWGKGICREGTTPLAPNSLYGTCKNSLREMVEAYCQQRGVSSAWGRVFLLYGPHEAPQRLVPAAIHAVLEGKPLHVTHAGDVRDFSYTPDAAGALAALLDSDIRGPVNIASGEPVSLGNLASHVAHIMQRPDLAPTGAADSCSQTPEVIADVSRLRNEVGWRPENDLMMGLRRTIEWWQVHGYEPSCAAIHSEDNR